LHLLFVAITYGQVYGSGKAWKTQGIFFSYFVATLLEEFMPVVFSDTTEDIKPCSPEVALSTELSD